MVRTKDLVLIVVVLIMLIMAISSTVAARLGSQQQNDPFFGSTESTSEAYSAVAPDSSRDRQSHINRLKAELAKGNVIDASPSVEASPIPEGQQPEGSMSCPVPDTGIAIARSWPLTGVSVKIVGASRLVVTREAPPMTSNASGTTGVESAGLETIVLSLPLFPSQQASPVCPDSEIIGVTVDGSLIFNTDATLYRNSGPETLIGYARDGFPIYGAYGGEVDQCGGYNAPTGYRYVAPLSGNKFLNCFVAQPQSFRQ